MEPALEPLFLPRVPTEVPGRVFAGALGVYTPVFVGDDGRVVEGYVVDPLYPLRPRPMLPGREKPEPEFMELPPATDPGRRLDVPHEPTGW